MTLYRIELFALFRALRDNEVVGALPSRRCEELLTYLLLAPTEQHQRSTLAGFFWPDQTDERAAGLLRQNLYLLQNWLTHELQCPQLLDVQRQRVIVHRALVDVDITAFEQAYAATTAHHHRSLAGCPSCLEALAAVLPLTQNSPILRTSRRAADNYLNWLDLRFGDVQRALSVVFEARCQAHVRSGAVLDAISTAQRWLELDPWHEPAQRALIAALARAGRRTEALRQFERSRELLKQELALDVEPATLLLAERVRSNQALNGTAAVQIAAAALFGRDEELAVLRQLLSSADRRLITIVGIGGVGKTTLARAIAAEQQTTFIDGAVFVALDSVNDGDGLIRTIADTLQLRLDNQRAAVDQLARALDEREILLLLDNLEQIADAGSLINRLLEKTQRPVILATSRRPLHLQRETLIRLDGLQLDEDATHEGSAHQLFLARARQYDGRRDWAGEHAAIDEICRLCGGMPLAIELAAYQARYRSCREIADALTQQMSLLEAGLSDIPARQRSIGLVLQETWQLLQPQAQLVLSALSLFRSSFSFAAALAVTAPIADERQIDDALQHAVDLGLLRRTAGSELATHPLVQQYLGNYAAEHAAALLPTTRAYYHYHLQVLIAANLRFINEQSRAWARQQQRQRDDIVQAWQLAAAAGEYELLLEAATALTIFGAAGDWPLRADRLLSNTLQRYEALPPVLRRRLPALRTFLYQEHQDPRLVEPVLHELLAEPLPEPITADHAQGLRIRAFLAILAGKLDGVMADLERSCLTVTDPALPFVTASPDGLISRYITATGDYGRAEPLWRKALQQARTIGDQRAELGVLNELALLPARLGDFRRSVPLLEESLELARRLNDSTAICALLANIASARQMAGGDVNRALSELEEAAEIARRSANLGYLRLAMSGLGRITHLLGRHTVAVDFLRQKLLLDCELGYQGSTGEILVWYIESLAALGRMTPLGSLVQFAADFPKLSAELRQRLDSVHRQVLDRPLSELQAAADTGPAVLRTLI